MKKVCAVLIMLLFSFQSVLAQIELLESILSIPNVDSVETWQTDEGCEYTFFVPADQSLPDFGKVYVFRSIYTGETGVHQVYIYDNNNPCPPQNPAFQSKEVKNTYRLRWEPISLILLLLAFYLLYRSFKGRTGRLNQSHG